MSRVLAACWGVGFLCLMACGRGAGSAPDPTVHFYQFSLPGFQETFDALVERFEKEHPPHRVRVHRLPPTTGDQHQFYLTHLAESQQSRIDVFALDVIWMAEFARAGLLMPVDTVIAEADWQRFFPAMRQAARYGDRRFAVPYFIDGGLLYSRADLLERHGFSAPPETWQELIRMARTVMQQERDPALGGFVWQGRQYEGLICNFIEFSPAGLDLNPEQMHRPSHRAALEQTLSFMRDLVWRHRVSPESVLAMSEEESRHVFQNGHAVFMRNWPYAWRLMQQPGSPVAGRVWASPLPAHRSGATGHGALGGFLLGIARHTPVPEAARAWVRFLAGPWAQQRLVSGLGLTPARGDLLGQETGGPGLPADLLRRIMASTRPRPVTPLYIPLSQSLQAYVSGALVGAYPPSEALRRLDADLERLSRVLS